MAENVVVRGENVCLYKSEFKKLSFPGSLTLPSDKFLDLSELKAFAEDKIDVTKKKKKLKFV